MRLDVSTTSKAIETGSKISVGLYSHHVGRGVLVLRSIRLVSKAVLQYIIVDLMLMMALKAILVKSLPDQMASLM
jgi:hypothetical protein